MLKDANYMKRMGELLSFHEVIKRPEDLTEGNFDEMILAFQEKVDIMADGIPKWETLWQLQFPWIQKQPKLSFVKCDSDKLPGVEGSDHVWLRKDAADRFNALRAEVLSLGGVLPVLSGKRLLTEKESFSKSVTSMHYPGLAFDLAGASGFFKPESDPFVVVSGGNGYWEVMMRVKNGPETKLSGFYWENETSGVDLTTTVSGKFVSFTKLASQYGFYPIRPRLSYSRARDRKYIGCEWWHFQANDLLIPGCSQLGIELLRIEEYTPEFLRNANDSIWGRKQAIYGVDWF